MLANQNKQFAEIIESSLLGWLAQSWQWDTFPTFGSLVVIENKKRLLFGIVHQIQTGSMDPVRYPFAYQKTEEELLREQPQIFEFLKTTFSCLTLGYKQNHKIFYQLAPEPPKIHSFVALANKEYIQEFFAHNNYLHTLFGLSNQLFNLDELLLALLKNLHDQNILSEDSLQSFIQTFSLLIGNDYRRLKLFLQRVEPLFN
jgi:hypothetical protein